MQNYNEIIDLIKNLAEQKEIDPLLLNLETWLVREEGSGTREMQEKGFKQLGFSPKKYMTFGSTQVKG